MLRDALLRSAPQHEAEGRERWAAIARFRIDAGGNLRRAGDLMNRPSGLKIQTKLERLPVLARWGGDVHSRGETRMRRIVLTLAALAAFGIALPAATTQPASAETVVIKKDRGHHYGWRNRDRDRVVIMKRHHREYREHRGATVGVQVR
jgi:hypothetical protein